MLSQTPGVNYFDGKLRLVFRLGFHASRSRIVCPINCLELKCYARKNRTLNGER